MDPVWTNYSSQIRVHKEMLTKSISRAFVLVITLAVFVNVAYGQEAAIPSSGANQFHADLGQATLSAPIVVDASALPEGAAAGNQLPPPRPRGGVSEEEYEKRKAEAARSFGMTGGAQGSAPSDARVLPPTPPASLVFPAQAQVGTITPSDMALAVSPNSYEVQVVNSTIAVYDKFGVLQSGWPKALSTFFPGTSGDLGDPRAFYDLYWGRFVVLVDDFTAGVVHLAASVTNNPLGSWYEYSVSPWGAANCRANNSPCPDFPQLGYDDTTIYVGVNYFPASGSVSDWMLLLPRQKIYAGTLPAYNYWFNLSYGSVNVDTVQPTTLLAIQEHPRAGIAVNTFNINFGGTQCRTGCNGLIFWAFSNNLVATGSPGPEISGVKISTANTYFFPAQANEPGCPNCIDTGDVRISGTPIYHGGMVTGSFNTNGASHSRSLWFQARVFLNDNDPRCTGSFTNLCPQITGAQLLHEDCFFCGGQGANGSSYYGTLAPDIGGDLSMVYNYSDDSTYPETAYTTRRATQAVNTMHDAGFVLCGGSSLYLQGRWGDYTANVGDLAAYTPYNSFWLSGMNSIAGGNWGTCVGQLNFSAINQP
jgi:hypothetical protein